MSSLHPGSDPAAGLSWTHSGSSVLSQPLFMSAHGEDESGPQESGPSAEPRPDIREEEEEEEGAGEEEEGPDGHGGNWTRDCVVCQNAAVNRVLLPCRHACVCDGCVSHFQHCPMCRAFVIESFTLSAAAASS